MRTHVGGIQGAQHGADRAREVQRPKCLAAVELLVVVRNERLAVGDHLRDALGAVCCNQEDVLLQPLQDNAMARARPCELLMCRLLSPATAQYHSHPNRGRRQRRCVSLRSTPAAVPLNRFVIRELLDACRSTEQAGILGREGHLATESNVMIGRMSKANLTVMMPHNRQPNAMTHTRL